MNDPKKVHENCQPRARTYEWCVNEMGVEFLPGRHRSGRRPHSVPALCDDEERFRLRIVLKEIEWLGKKLGRADSPPQPMSITCPQQQENEGPVLGVVVHEGFVSRRPASGKQKAIRGPQGCDPLLRAASLLT